jgi:hypothetical protein
MFWLMPNSTEKLTRLRGSATRRQSRRASPGPEKGAAEAEQKLAEHQLFRAGEGVGLAVEQRGNHDQRQGGGGRPVELLRVERQAAGDDPAQNAGEN